MFLFITHYEYASILIGNYTHYLSGFEILCENLNEYNAFYKESQRQYFGFRIRKT